MLRCRWASKLLKVVEGVDEDAREAAAQLLGSLWTYPCPTQGVWLADAFGDEGPCSLRMDGLLEENVVALDFVTGAVMKDDATGGTAWDS